MPTPFAAPHAGGPAPQAIADVALPRRQRFHPSPGDWRDEVLYFLLVDRFSDASEATRPLVDRANCAAARPAGHDGQAWRWDRWAESGAARWQGGTLAGVRSKLGYLADLGITAIWLSPVFKQRGHLDTFHGYGIQDFLDVDPRFGTRTDLVALCDAAHQLGIRIILDIIFNHSGFNGVYPGGVAQPPYRPFPDHQDFGAWLGRSGAPIQVIAGREDGVWPRELQDLRNYTRAGHGDLGAGDIGDEHAEHKRTDFVTLRSTSARCGSRSTKRRKGWRRAARISPRSRPASRCSASHLESRACTTARSRRWPVRNRTSASTCRAGRAVIMRTAICARRCSDRATRARPD